MIAYSKSVTDGSGSNTVVVVVNLDHHTRRRRSRWTCRNSAWTGTSPCRCARRAHRRDLQLGQGQLSILSQGIAPRTSSPSCDRPHRRSEGHPPHDRQRARSGHFRGHPGQGPRPRLVQTRRLLRGPGPLLPGQQRRRHRRPQGPHRETRLPAMAGHRLPVAARSSITPAGTAATTSRTTAVLPEFGDLADFVEFVDAAHQRPACASSSTSS